ncbi:MAG: hypothetical protein IPF52_00065 [Saprospiraceae bacterium]|nr:hypothetical protein [Saprospiraceae bacterium]
MRPIILFFTMMLFVCSQQSQVKPDDVGYTGTYFDPITGEILFKIFKDSTDYKLKDISFNPRVYREGNFEKVQIFDKDQEDRWGKFCGEGFSKIMENVLGGSDWKENTIWYIVVEEIFIIKVRKGYQSDEHVYNTNYVVVEGSECFNNLRVRRNIEKM